MHKKIVFILITISIYLIICNLIYTNTNNTKIGILTTKKITVGKIMPYIKEEPIGKLIINKININNNLYKIDSRINNVEENITILKGSIEPNYRNSIMFIAAHSGTGKIAYFKNLNRLNLNDELILIYKNKTYKYIINKIWEDKKDGYIHVKKESKKQLVLTTCSPLNDDKQLIINSTLKRVTY